MFVAFVAIADMVLCYNRSFRSRWFKFMSFGEVGDFGKILFAYSPYALKFFPRI
jgi:hypothetical protein